MSTTKMKFRLISNDSSSNAIYWLWLEYSHPGRKPPNTLSVLELKTDNYDELKKWITQCEEIALANHLELVDEISYDRMRCIVSLSRVKE